MGWAKDDYLFFDEEAEALANEVGNLIVNIETDSLRVRKSPSLDSGIYGLLKAEDELDVIEVVDDDWICVDYDGKNGYVSTEYVSTEFHIDSGKRTKQYKAETGRGYCGGKGKRCEIRKTSGSDT